jgi:hypothetical protein
MRPDFRRTGMVVPTVPPQIPLLEDGDLPGEEDWAVLELLRAATDAAGEPGPDRGIARALARGERWTDD